MSQNHRMIYEEVDGVGGQCGLAKHRWKRACALGVFHLALQEQWYVVENRDNEDSGRRHLGSLHAA